MIKQTYLYIFILIGVWLTGCQDFDTPITNPVDIDGKTVEVSLATKVPAISIMTRGEASNEEKQLEHIDILVFKVYKNGSTTTEKFAYHTYNTNDLSGMEQNSEDVYIKAKLKLSEEEEEYRIVLVANLKEELAEFFKEDDHENKTKEELIKEITFIQDKKWPTGDNGNESFRALPMWAESSKTTTVTKNTNADSFGDINFIRSVARIDLSVSLSTSTLENGSDLFEIQEVTVYNARKIGRAIPDAENLTNGKATMPSLAAEDTIAKANMVYKKSISDNKIANIYVNEARNQEDGKETSDALFLIIKAVYKGEDPNNTIPTYYKVGFYDDNSKPVDILRNFTYKMFITSVKGAGEDDEEDAIKSNSNNLTVALTEWSDFEMKYVVFSGKYYLAVSECKLTVPKSANSHSFLVKTNHPDGWQAAIKEEKTWISGLPASSTQIGTSESLEFEVKENDEGENRESEINITAGNLTLDVLVTQTTKKEYTLHIEIDDQDNVGSYLEFDKTITFTSGYHEYYETHEITPRKLKIIWTPEDEKLIVDYNRYFDWGDQTDIKPFYEGGSAEITVIPKRLEERDDWYPEAVGDIQIQVGDESSTAQNVLIRRRHHEVYIEKADRYIVKAGENSFKLYANTGWKIMNPFTDGQQWLGDLVVVENLKTKGDSNIDKGGEDIVFTFKDDIPGNISADLSVLIVFDDIDQEISKEYTFHIYKEEDPGANERFGEESNCYVLQTGGKSVSIPVSQANRFSKEYPNSYATNPIGAGQELKVEFLWTDHKNGFDKNKDNNCPVISAVLEEGNSTGPEARIIITSGDAPGNAVIAVTNSAGDIHWSWHIWVTDTDFDPYDESKEWPAFRYYEFLDRNLGALSATPGTQESMGLYYQWGRKDPFPSAAGVKSTNFSKRYTKKGEDDPAIAWTPLIGGWTEMGNKNLLLQSIKDPLTFIGSGSYANWFSADWSATATENFWNEMEKGSLSTSKKGIFDPCPEGWKTVPGGAQLNLEWNDLPHVVVYDSNGNYSTIKNQGNGLDLGVWPHTGYISRHNGQLTSPTEGHYWTGTANDYYYAFRTHFWGTASAHPSISHDKAIGHAVRCMRRVDKEK